MKSVTEQTLDIITRTRGEVLGHKELTGENLFMVWGYPTAVFLLLEFAALMLLHQNWCIWIWLGIPLVGAPLMFYFLRKDYDHTHSRTLEANIILQMWMFVGFISCLGGFLMGCADVFEICYCTFQGLLVSMGCFVTGVILRFRPKTLCGFIGAILTLAALFFQGEKWPWQLLVTAVVAIITLIIPGHLFRRYVRKMRSVKL